MAYLLQHLYFVILISEVILRAILQMFTFKKPINKIKSVTVAPGK